MYQQNYKAIIFSSLLMITLLTNGIMFAQDESQEGDQPKRNHIFLPLVTNSEDEQPSDVGMVSSANLGTAAKAKMATDQIIVHYRKVVKTDPRIRSAQLASLQEVAGVQLNYVRDFAENGQILKLPSRLPLTDVKSIAGRLSTLPDVEYAEADQIMRHQLEPNDSSYNLQWHYFAPTAGSYGANLPQAWDITTGSSSVVVAVLDTGILFGHPDLAGRTVAGYDFIADVPTGNDGDGRDNDPSDPGDWCDGDPSSWHGTHVAGTIGANSNNNTGVAGINWVSKIQPVRVLGTCGGYTSDIADAIRWSAGLSVSGVPVNSTPAKVINLSLGGGGSCSTITQNAVNAAVGAGAVVVVAAGNENDNAANYSPANCNNVITVASTGPSGNRAYYSNYGSSVEISAPGGDVTNGSSDGVLSTLNNGTTTPGSHSYAFYQGTSMAAPHIAGIISLMFSVEPSLTPAAVLSILQSTVTPFPNGSTCTTSLCGPGIVNAAAAVGTANGNWLAPPTNLNAVAISELSIELTWTDNSSDEIGFEIERCQGTNCTNFTQIATVNANVTTYVDAGLAADTAYRYRVRAIKSASTSTFSNSASATTLGANCTLYRSTNVPIAIVDNTMVESTLSVPDSFVLTDVNVANLQIIHTWNSDLIANLISPASTTVELFDGVGGNGDNFEGTRFDDAATVAITSGNAPFADTYRPSGSLNSLNGESAAGIWRLQITDTATQDTGSIEGWALELCGQGVTDLIFADDFESGDLSAWTASANSGSMAVSGAAAMVGSQGLAININSNTPTYLTDETPNAEARYRARFYFDPNSITMADRNLHNIFYGYSTSNQASMLLQMRYFGGTYRLRARVRADSGGWQNTSWYLISDALHIIEFDWQGASTAGANDGHFTLWLNGVPRVELTGIDNDSHRLNRIRLGVVAGIDNGTRGTYFFDAFESRRESYIGPAVSEPTTPMLFADDFESGNLSGWTASANSGSMAVSGAAAMVGSQGLAINITSNTPTYLTDETPNAEARYRARFYFDPNSITMVDRDLHNIFYGYSTSNQASMLLQMRYFGGTYRLRARVRTDSGSWQNTSWYLISDALHIIEFDWQGASTAGANDGHFTLWLNGVQRVELTGIDNDSHRLNRVRLGVVAGIDSGTRGTYFFDAFASHQTAYIGPASGATAATTTALQQVKPAMATGTTVTTSLNAGIDNRVSGQLHDWQIDFTVAAADATVATAALLVAIANDVLPDGYAQVGTAFDIQLLESDGTPLETTVAPLAVTIDYGAVNDAITAEQSITLQTWNADEGRWEIVPATVDTTAKTIVANIDQPTILAIMQAEVVQTHQLYLPFVQQ